MVTIHLREMFNDTSIVVEHELFLYGSGAYRTFIVTASGRSVRVEPLAGGTLSYDVVASAPVESSVD